MADWIALMRGINVGSTRKLPMIELRALCDGLGWERPETYIQSGNLIVGAPGNEAKVRVALEKAIAERFGMKVDVIVRAASDWQGFADTNPFAGDTKALPKLVHLCLSRDPLKDGATEALRERAVAGERIEAVGGALWIDFAESGVARSKLTPAYIDKCAGSPVTARNWNSVLKIGEMIAGRA
jgi:uncharacterized protein (DUF1697 family)